MDWLGKAGDKLTSNPGLALSALGLGASALKSGQVPKGYNQLLTQAGALGTQGNALTTGALDNALPPAAQAQLNMASESAKASVRSTYARMGLTGSTMEAQALASVDETTAAQGYQMIQSLYQQGLQTSQLSASLYDQIMQANVSGNNALSGAVGNFAGALGGASLKG